MDFLKTIRAHHWVLLVLSATAFITSVVPRSAVNYWLAYEELLTLEYFNNIVPLSALVGLYNSRLLGYDINDQVGVTVMPQPNILDVQRHLQAGWETISRLLKATFSDEGINFSTASLSQMQQAFGLAFYLPIPGERELETLRGREVPTSMEMRLQMDSPSRAYQEQ